MTHHLAGTTEVGLMLGVSRQRVDQLAARADFPPALTVLANGRIWDTAQVVRWAKATQKWPALRELFEAVANAAEHWQQKVRGKGPAGDGLELTTKAMQRAVMVTKAELGTDTTTENAQLWMAIEKISVALRRNDPKLIVDLALKTAEVARQLGVGFAPQPLAGPSFVEFTSLDGLPRFYRAAGDPKIGTVWVPVADAMSDPQLGWIYNELDLRASPENGTTGPAIFRVPRQEWHKRIAPDGTSYESF